MWTWYVNAERSRAVLLDGDGRVFSVIKTPDGNYKVVYETVREGFWCGVRDTLLEAQILAQAASAAMVAA
jgi:hypothetical protein